MSQKPYRMVPGATISKAYSLGKHSRNCGQGIWFLGPVRVCPLGIATSNWLARDARVSGLSRGTPPPPSAHTDGKGRTRPGPRGRGPGCPGRRPPRGCGGGRGRAPTPRPPPPVPSGPPRSAPPGARPPMVWGMRSLPPRRTQPGGERGGRGTATC